MQIEKHFVGTEGGSLVTSTGWSFSSVPSSFPGGPEVFCSPGARLPKDERVGLAYRGGRLLSTSLQDFMETIDSFHLIQRQKVPWKLKSIHFSSQ